MSKRIAGVEVCDGQAVDEDCDGNPNTGCDCKDGTPQSCTTDLRGPCRPGQQTCSQGKWGACQSLVTPKPSETLCDGQDEDCDGDVDDNAPCGFGQRCYNGSCKTWCTDLGCAQRSADPCRIDICDSTTGECVPGNPAERGTQCTTSDAKPGYCEAGGRCLRDTEVLCKVAGALAPQWLFKEGTYNVCEPNNAAGPCASDGFGPCETKESHRRVVWDLIDGGNGDGIDILNVETVRSTGESKSCSGNNCRVWFSNPHLRDNSAKVRCVIFDDATSASGEAVAGQNENQWLPAREGGSHPSGRHPGASVCTPNTCRKWVGRCKVQ